MKKRILSILCAGLMLLSACGQPSGDSGAHNDSEDKLTVLATTYPLYLFARALTQNVDGVEVQRLNTGNISCLHDYTLSVGDMKLIEAADLVVINGVGLETFMDDALASARSAVVDCSKDVPLLDNLSHHHKEGDEHAHDHGHYDPHIWLDPDNAKIMVSNLAAGLIDADPEHQSLYEANMKSAHADLEALDDAIEDLFENAAVEITGLITFHDGFQYFANAFDLPLLASIEEEAGSEASAKEINEITSLVKERSIPVIFTERNGSDATAQAIARETGCAVAELSMLMSGDGTDLSAYTQGLMENAAAVINGFAGAEVVSAA